MLAAKFIRTSQDKVQLELANIKRILLLPFAILWIILLFASHVTTEIIEEKSCSHNIMEIEIYKDIAKVTSFLLYYDFTRIPSPQS